MADYKSRLVVQEFSRILGMTVTRDLEKRGHHHQPEILYGGRGTALRYERLQSRVNHQSKAGTDPKPTGGETAETTQAALTVPIENPESTEL